MVRSVRCVIVVGAVALVGAGCHGSSSTSAPTTGKAAQAIHQPTEAGLKAAATAYANAFLTGTYRDLVAVLDPSCMPTDKAALSTRLGLGDAELHRFQQLVKQRTGIDAAKIEIRTVDLRNVHGKAGDAEAKYGLPAAVEGNDNWNSYAYSGSQWHIAGCDLKFPMGGQSTDAASATTTS